MKVARIWCDEEQEIPGEKSKTSTRIVDVERFPGLKMTEGQYGVLLERGGDKFLTPWSQIRQVSYATEPPQQQGKR